MKVFRSRRHKFSCRKDPSKCPTHKGTSLNFRLTKTVRKFHKLSEWDRMGEVHTNQTSEFSTETLEAGRHGTIGYLQIQKEKLKFYTHPHYNLNVMIV